MPAQAAISERHDRDAREEDSNPPRLGRGDTRGSSEARDHFIEAPVAEQTTGIRLLNGTTQVQFLPGAKFLSTHRVCGPPVKRCELGAMPRGGAISKHGARPVGRGRCLENSRTSNGVQGSSPWRSAFLTSL